MTDNIIHTIKAARRAPPQAADAQAVARAAASNFWFNRMCETLQDAANAKTIADQRQSFASFGVAATQFFADRDTANGEYKKAREKATQVITAATLLQERLKETIALGEEALVDAAQNFVIELNTRHK